MIANADLAAGHLRAQNGNASLIDPALFKNETDTTHTALIEERKAKAAARSRAAYAESNAQLGDRWRRKARREGRRGELWKPFSKRLILPGIKI
eukprot:8404315-Pyramimonas_sp.AAC.1